MPFTFYQESENKEILNIILKAAKKASAIQKENFRKDFKVDQKSSFRDLVTEVDIASQKIIEETIQSEMIKAGYNQDQIAFYGEESKERKLGEYTFVIDPLDGTANFATGFPLFSISIGLSVERDGARETKVALIYNSLQDEVYVGIKDQGSYKLELKNNSFKKLEIIQKEMNQSVVTGNFGLLRKFPNSFFEQVFGSRILYGFALEACYVAENISQANFSFEPRIWDVIAAELIVNEAGAVMLDYQQNQINKDFENPSKPYKCLTVHPNMAKKFVQESQVLKFI
jgi:myo-inositol-1(or 4)-monophosphatase